MAPHPTCAQLGMRECVTALPEQLLSPPYELRTEMNWIDFSGTANPLPRRSSAPWRTLWPQAS